MSSGYDYRFCGFLPSLFRQDGNLLSHAMGWQPADGETYSVPLSADGLEPATHWGFSAQINASTKALVEGQTLPAGVPWEAFGLTEARAGGVLVNLKYAIGAVAPEQAAAQFTELATAHGLARIHPALP